MKVQILGFFALIAISSAAVVPITTTTLLRSPVLDTAVVRSERVGDSFAYSTVTANGYTQYVQGLPYYTYNPYVRQVIIPQYTPQVYYPPTVVQSVGQPAYYPTYATVPAFGGIPVNPAVNPENPVEVEDPADGTANVDTEKENVKVDEDTVSVESA